MSQPSEKTDEQVKQKQQTLLVCSALVVITIIAFEQIRHNQFVYDDLLYITQNTQVTDGLTVDSIRWAFTTTYAGSWHPVTWLSHILDCQLFHLNPLWPHLENLLLHTVNVLLLFWIIKSVTGAIWRSGFVAALFAIHPVHVESVAWAAERKDLLCGLFWMLTIAAYIRYARKPGFGRYLLMLIAFVLGLLSKPMMVTLPFVLLLLDYWPLKRLKRQSILEKLPLFVLAAASIAITFIAQQRQGAMDMLEPMSLDIRAANASISYITYISKMIYPSRLAALYPHPGKEVELWDAAMSLGMVILITVIVFLLGRRKRYLFLGWLWYIGTLFPVIGLVQIGVQGMADRYTYLPSIGFFIMVTWGAAELSERRRFLKIALPISAIIVVSLLVVCTRKQVQYWKNNFTLFERALLVTRNNPTILYNMGAVMQTERNFDLALKCYHQALRYKTDYFQADNNIGSILRQQGNLDDATIHIRRALQINPEYPQAHNNLGLALAAQGNLSEAIAHFRQALETTPDFVEARQNLAAALQSSGKYDEAISHYREILQLDSGHLVSLNTLARILTVHPVPEQRNPAEAVLLAERAAKLTRQQNPAILETLAAAYAATGQFDRAVATTQQAITLTSTANSAEFTEHLRKRLELYKQKKPSQMPIQEKSANHQ